MFTLSYSAAYDPFHTIFRFTALLVNSAESSQSFGVLQISDFYLCFPWLLADISAPRSVQGFQKTRNALLRVYKPNSYDLTPTASTLFERMEPIQLAAFSAMLSKQFLDREAASKGVLKLIPNMLSSRFRDEIDEYVRKNKELIDFLASDLPKVPLAGKDGLKHRTGLKEHRYDNV